MHKFLLKNGKSVVFRDILRNSVPRKVLTLCEAYGVFHPSPKSRIDWVLLKRKFWKIDSQCHQTPKNRSRRVVEGDSSQSVDFWFEMVRKSSDVGVLLKKSFRIFVIRKLIQSNQNQLQIHLRNYKKIHKKFVKEDLGELSILDQSNDLSSLAGVLPVTNIFQSKYKNTKIRQRQQNNLRFMNKVHRPYYLEDIPELSPKSTQLPSDFFLQSKKSPSVLEEPDSDPRRVPSGAPLDPENSVRLNLFKKKQTRVPEAQPNQFTVVENAGDLTLLELDQTELPFAQDKAPFQESFQKLSQSANEENPDSSHEAGFQAHEFYLRKRQKEELERTILNFVRLDRSVSKSVENICLVLKTLSRLYSQHRLRLTDSGSLHSVLSVAFHQDNSTITQNVLDFLHQVIIFGQDDASYSSLMK